MNDPKPLRLIDPAERFLAKLAELEDELRHRQRLADLEDYEAASESEWDEQD